MKWQDCRLGIATPMRGNDKWLATMRVGTREQIDNLRRSWTGVHLIPEIGYSVDIVRARNRVAAMVLRELSHLTHVLWWDDDLWPEDIRIVPEMLETGHDVIGAVYTTKAEPPRTVHRSGNMLGAGPTYEVEALGFGFTITSVAALETLSRAARKYADYPRPHKIANIFGQVYERVHPTSEDPEDESLASEDISFCRRWRDIGGKVYLYDGAIIEHVGTRRYSVRDMMGEL